MQYVNVVRKNKANGAKSALKSERTLSTLQLDELRDTLFTCFASKSGESTTLSCDVDPKNTISANDHAQKLCKFAISINKNTGFVEGDESFDEGLSDDDVEKADADIEPDTAPAAPVENPSVTPSAPSTQPSTTPAAPSTTPAAPTNGGTVTPTPPPTGQRLLQALQPVEPDVSIDVATDGFATALADDTIVPAESADTSIAGDNAGSSTKSSQISRVIFAIVLMTMALLI